MNDEADDWELFDLDEGEVVVVEAAKKGIKCIHVPYITYIGRHILCSISKCQF